MLELEFPRGIVFQNGNLKTLKTNNTTNFQWRRPQKILDLGFPYQSKRKKSRSFLLQCKNLFMARKEKAG